MTRNEQDPQLSPPAFRVQRIERGEASWSVLIRVDRFFEVDDLLDADAIPSLLEGHGFVRVKESDVCLGQTKVVPLVAPCSPGLIA
jgi:hypothetical protein